MLFQPKPIRPSPPQTCSGPNIGSSPGFKLEPKLSPRNLSPALGRCNTWHWAFQQRTTLRPLPTGMLLRQDQPFSASLATEAAAVRLRRCLLLQDLLLHVQTSKCFKTATGQCLCCCDPMPSGIIGGAGLLKRLQMIRRLRVTSVL